MNVWNITPHQDGDTIACSAIYGFIEHAISLGSEFLPGVDYTLIVNDVELTFSLPGS